MAEEDMEEIVEVEERRWRIRGGIEKYVLIMEGSCQ